MNLALNNLKWLICHKTKPNQTTFGKGSCQLGIKQYDYCSSKRTTLALNNP